MNGKMRVGVSVLFALAVCLLAGCAKQKKSGSGPKKITLTVWESNGGPNVFIRRAGEAYSALHPNIEIKYVNVEIGDAAGQVALDGPAMIGPDLFAAPHDKLGELVMGGHVLPTVNNYHVRASVLGVCASALTYDGTMYGYPVSAETYALFYNKDLISDSELPSTWTQLSDWARVFNKRNPGKYGFVMDVGSGYYTIVFTTANGNRLFGPSGTDTTNTHINNADAVSGMKFFQGLRAAILDVPAADLGTAICDSAFAAQKAALYITGPWNIKNFTDAGLNFGVMPLPAFDVDSTPSSSFSGTRAMFVSAYTDYPEEAAEFAQFLISPEMQKLRFELTGAIPAINVQVDSPYFSGFLRQLDYAFPMPSIPEMGSYWEAMNNASKNIWNGADVQKELDACNNAILGK